MNQNNRSTIYAGLNVAKASLAVDFQGGAHALTNDAKGQSRLVRLLSGGPNVHVVLEATGGYERKALSLPKGQPAVRALHAAGIALRVVEPGRVRAFARALGQRAKTDRLDAAVLSASLIPNDGGILRLISPRLHPPFTRCSTGGFEPLHVLESLFQNLSCEKN